MIYSKRSAIALVIALSVPLLLADITGAQTQTNTAPKTSTDAASTTIKAQVRQVLLDVVVTDSRNRPITGLKREDFSVSEDGKPQQIVSFETHASANHSADSATPSTAVPQLPPNTFWNVSSAREDLPLNIILFDVLNTPFADQPLARRQIKKFLTGKPTGSRYGIFVLSDKLHLVQGVTDSEAELLAAMNGRATRTQSPVFGPPDPNTVASDVFLRDSGLVPPYPGPMAMLDHLGQLNSQADQYFLTHRVDITLAAFNELAQFLGGVPGRKNVLWLSGSFPIVFPGRGPLDRFQPAVSFSPELRQATNQLTISQVAVYPIDVRGLIVAPIMGAANNRNYHAASLGQARRSYMVILAQEQATMDEIAEVSGGHAFYNTNGFEQALQTASEDGSNYYTLSYSPTNTKFDGGIRSIHVRVNGKGYSLSYRRSYFADDDFERAKRSSHTAIQSTDAEMLRGAPTQHDVVFSVHAKTMGNPIPLSQTQIEELSQFPGLGKTRKWATVKMQKYELDYSLLRKQISYLIGSDGLRHGTLDFLYAAYDVENNLLYRATSSVSQTILPDQAEQARSGIYLARQSLDIPANTSWLRIGVRDGVDGRTGSLEVALPLRPE